MKRAIGILFFLTTLQLLSSGLRIDLMAGGGYTKGSTVLSTDLFSIDLNSGANYEVKAQLLFFGLGIEGYYSVNSLLPDAFSLYPKEKLDFSDQFTNYGLGVVFGGKGNLSPYISLKYGKTKFTGSHKYVPDGKHVIGSIGAKFVLKRFGIWGEVKFMRMIDILKEWENLFKDNGNFNTISITGGLLLRI